MPKQHDKMEVILLCAYHSATSSTLAVKMSRPWQGEPLTQGSLLGQSFAALSSLCAKNPAGKASRGLILGV